MGKSAVNILRRAPSGTAVDGHTAMIPAGDGSSDHYPRQVCSSKCPVSETLNLITITQRSLSIPPAHSGSLQLEVRTIYSQFKTCLKLALATRGCWGDIHCLFSRRQCDMQVLPKKDPRGGWLIKTAKQATQAGICQHR